MPEQKTSCNVVVFPNGAEARRHGPGGLWYRWREGSPCNFPQDVTSVMIVMPVTWEGKLGIVTEWTVSHKNPNGAQWSLSGKEKAPTLSPSLHWRGFWHGFLRKGFLHSC